eukprot:8303544-Alexandrium_andersonii.AAC.1
MQAGQPRQLRGPQNANPGAHHCHEGPSPTFHKDTSTVTCEHRFSCVCQRMLRGSRGGGVIVRTRVVAKAGPQRLSW